MLPESYQDYMKQNDKNDNVFWLSENKIQIRKIQSLSISCVYFFQDWMTELK